MIQTNDTLTHSDFSDQFWQIIGASSSTYNVQLKPSASACVYIYNGRKIIESWEKSVVFYRFLNREELMRALKMCYLHYAIKRARQNPKPVRYEMNLFACSE